jgi:RHS repeat-associated protein
MPRVARIVIPEMPHHITQRGNNRQDVFFVDDVDSSGYANDNPYRFSSKWLDDDLTTGDNNGGAIESSGLYYYGYRYYSPNFGRFVSLDPLGKGNLYRAMVNNLIDSIDFIGLKTYFTEAYNVDKNDICCVESKARWDADGYASGEECENDCVSVFTSGVGGGCYRRCGWYVRTKRIKSGCCGGMWYNGNVGG